MRAVREPGGNARAARGTKGHKEALNPAAHVALRHGTRSEVRTSPPHQQKREYPCPIYKTTGFHSQDSHNQRQLLARLQHPNVPSCTNLRLPVARIHLQRHVSWRRSYEKPLRTRLSSVPRCFTTVFAEAVDIVVGPNPSEARRKMASFRNATIRTDASCT